MTSYLDDLIDFTDARVASALDEVSGWSARFAQMIYQHLELRQPLTALDIGCGTGVPLLELAQMHGAACQFSGVDVWEAGLERAAYKLGSYGLRNVHLHKIDGARLPFAAAHFDLLVSNLGVNNFEDPEAMLAECARVAKNGARLVITTNIVGHMREFYAVFRETLAGNPAALARLAENEAQRGTRESHVRLIENAGFRIARVIEDAFALRYADGSAFLNHWLIRLGFLDAWRRVLEKADERATFAALEARLNTLAAQQGELRLTVPMLYIEALRA
ncbi:MAG: methyltransferase domain-containing protein [Chloroflexi bacterium]|nr:methyltransferase domain-containing protein [Chloroflexota bacterium]